MAAAPEIVAADMAFRKDYVLVREDAVDIVVLKHPEVSRECVVRPDGKISLPILDDVAAAGLTPAELDAKLTKLFSRRFVGPEITVVVTRHRPASVYVMGEVNRPSVVELRDASTVLQAVARSNDFTSRAAKGSVVLIRLTDGNRLTATQLDLRLRGRGAKHLQLHNIPLRPDDIVYVPKTRINNFSSFLAENITPILTAFNSGVSAINNVRFIQLIDRQIEWLEAEIDRPDSTVTPPLFNP